jgi:hypothetical protein
MPLLRVSTSPKNITSPADGSAEYAKAMRPEEFFRPHLPSSVLPASRVQRNVMPNGTELAICASSADRPLPSAVSIVP